VDLGLKKIKFQQTENLILFQIRSKVHIGSHQIHIVLDLQLSMQSVPITTKVVSSYPPYSEVYSIQHYVMKFVSDHLR